MSFQSGLASGWKPGQIRPLVAVNFLCEMRSKRPGQTCRFLGGYELTLAAAQETKKPEPHSFQMSPGWASAKTVGGRGGCRRDSRDFGNGEEVEPGLVSDLAGVAVACRRRLIRRRK